MKGRDDTAMFGGERVIDSPSKWNATKLFQLFCFGALCFLGLMHTDNALWDPSTRSFTITLGVLIFWRYGWWLTHFIRAELYSKYRFPSMRSKADTLWQSGWRPRHVHFMMTTFRERRDTTELVIASICREVRESGILTTLWLGSGDSYDEDIIMNYLHQHAGEIPLELVIVRQNVSGKRMAIGLTLRAMSRRGIDLDDLIVFMDGDSVLAPGILRACCPLFGIDQELQAVTTDEEVICYGPQWMQSWLTMRFAQRRIAMQSHSMSNKVLTLTGRMSVFRANHLSKYNFIRMVEADSLEHWLWGKYRFLSGDDKSTWYYMLTQDAKMLYVPDALVYTIEEVDGSGIARMTQNFRRWSGNMLRNGTRCLQLGPKKVGFFIWWCVLDQRIAMWTMLVSPVIAVSVAVLIDFSYLTGYVIWIAISRMLLTLFLFRYSKTVHMEWPFILYFNQLLNASVKVYCLARLSKQRWTNRGNQSSGGGDTMADKLKDLMAFWITTVWVATLVFSVLFYAGLVEI
jgi:glycosyltransferase Alg8